MSNGMGGGGGGGTGSDQDGIIIIMTIIYGILLCWGLAHLGQKATDRELRSSEINGKP